jgi:hypothetical protein
MDNRTDIGRIHPAFFKHSHLFSRFDKTFNEKGDVRMESPFFVLEYDFDSGVLVCDDKDVLWDFERLIRKAYGSGISRDEIKQSIQWDEMNDRWSVLNVGVCILPDSDAGWDGSPNAIWYDGERPGKIVDYTAQFWNQQMLFGAWKLDESDIMKLGGSVTVPNLVDSLIMHKGDKKKHDKIERLIGCID